MCIKKVDNFEDVMMQIRKTGIKGEEKRLETRKKGKKTVKRG